jgi:hypothetical protein
MARRSNPGATQEVRDTSPEIAPERRKPGPDGVSAGRPVRRLLAVTGLALGLYVVAAAVIVYVFGIKSIGYFFFDISDIPVYFKYATFMARGGRPYVDFQVEYPPLALPLFAVAGPPDHINPYASRFALHMLGVGGAAAVATAAAAARTWSAGRRPYLVAAAFAVAVAATGALLANRYDAAVALVFAACMLLLVYRWHWAAAAALGLGFALKLVPAILLPLVLLLAPSPRAAIRAAVAFAVAAALPFLPYLPEGLTGLTQVFAYHGARPLQVESVLATPIWIGQLLGMIEVQIGYGFGSQNVIAPGAEAIAGMSSALGLVMLALTHAVIWRRRTELRESPALVFLAMTAVLLSFLAFGKVLSPQFLIWLLPSVALLLPERRALGALLLATMVLTQIEFPANYFKFTALEPAAVACVVARNLALLSAFVLSLVELWRSPAETAAPRPEAR